MDTFKKVNQTRERSLYVHLMNRAHRVDSQLDSASQHIVRRPLSSMLDKPTCIEADVGSARMEGATSDVLPGYK